MSPNSRITQIIPAPPGWRAVRAHFKTGEPIVLDVVALGIVEELLNSEELDSLNDEIERVKATTPESLVGGVVEFLKSQCVCRHPVMLVMGPMADGVVDPELGELFVHYLAPGETEAAVDLEACTQAQQRFAKSRGR